MSEDIEAALRRAGYTRIAGIDEAGRGALAGPVVAAAVMLPPIPPLRGIDDSKKLRPAVREELYDAIRAHARAVAISMRAPAAIDQVNILQATLEAMRQAAEGLCVPPDFVLIDGNHAFGDSPWPVRTVTRGDARCQSIAAASIIAKVSRDRIMRTLHVEYPDYGWDTNVGYPTRAHYASLAACGPTPHHRKSFRLCAR